MKRKIIKLAEKTLVVSLPTAWLSSQNLVKGDELDCSIDNAKLVFSPPQQASKLTVEISLENVSERVLRWQISSLHKQGYDEIIVSNYSTEQYSVLQDLLNNLFIGFIVKEKSKLRIVIGEVAAVDVDEFDAMLRRGFRQLLQCFDELEVALQSKDTSALLDLEHENNKITNFCERLLNKHLIQKEKGHFWYVIAWNLEKIVDNFKYMAKDVPTLTLSKEQHALLLKTKEFVQGYYECFYDFSYDTLVQLNALKQELLKMWKEELLSIPHFAHWMHLIVLQTADFSASMIALSTTGEE